MLNHGGARVVRPPTLATDFTGQHLETKGVPERLDDVLGERGKEAPLAPGTRIPSGACVEIAPIA